MRDRRYHILYATTNSELGGGEFNLISLAANLDKERFRCSVICPPGPLVERLEASGVDVCPMELGGFASYGGVVPRLPWRTLWSVLKYARERRVDIVHSHHYEACKTFGLAARCLGAPSLWTCQAFWFPIIGVTGRYLAAVLDHTVAVSEFVKNKLLEGAVLREESVSVIYNGVDTPFFSEPLTDGQQFRQQFGIVDSNFVIGLIARLDPIKGHEDFLLALRQTVDKIPGIKAVLVGGEILTDASYVVRIRQLVEELGLAQSVIFTGFQENMPAIYDACDLIVAPSRGEAFGRVVVEAM